MYERFTHGIRYLPTLPTVLTQILAMLNDENSTARDLEGLITNDQALSSKVLTVANSSYYGFRHKILTVRRAVVALGYDELRNICLGASLMGFLHPATFRDRQAAELLWLHSVCVADAASLISSTYTKVDPDVAFTAGLLHDLGKVALSAFYPQDLEKVHALRKREKFSFRDAEKACELDHAKIGEALCRHWDLPPALTEAVGFHHDPYTGLDYYEVIGVVHLANYLAHVVQIGDSGNPDPPQARDRVVMKLGLDKVSLEALAGELVERRDRIISLWQMLLAT